MKSLHTNLKAPAKKILNSLLAIVFLDFRRNAPAELRTFYRAVVLREAVAERTDLHTEAETPIKNCLNPRPARAPTL